MTTLKNITSRRVLAMSPPNVMTQSFYLSRLAQQNQLISPTAWPDFQHQTGLADFFWQTTYHQPPGRMKQLAEILAEAEGLLIFLHGWDGSHRIWEDMPSQLVAQNPGLVCLNADVNGFGQTPFINNVPQPDQATLVAAMAAVEQWLQIIGARSPRVGQPQPYYLFVGHSMGAGMIFYKNEADWQDEIYGCYVMAPGLFYGNKLSEVIYKAVASATRLPYITPLKNLTARLVIRVAMNDASRIAKREHAQTFYHSSFETLADTLAGIGDSPLPDRRDWSAYRVTLGHRDILVRLGPTISMLEQLGFTGDQIKILVGDHYFFSYDDTAPVNHLYNRQVVINDLLDFCQTLKKRVKCRS